MSTTIRFSAGLNTLVAALAIFDNWSLILGRYAREQLAVYQEQRTDLLSLPRGRDVQEKWSWAEEAFTLKVRGIHLPRRQLIDQILVVFVRVSVHAVILGSTGGTSQAQKTGLESVPLGCAGMARDAVGVRRFVGT